MALSLTKQTIQLLDMEWSGTMTFNQRASRELILLLKQRTYEEFVRALQV